MSVQWEIDFDYQQFEKQLFEACRNAFREIQDKHKDETFYTFALYAGNIYENIHISANTEERLFRVANTELLHYLSESNFSLNDVTLYFRYRWHEYLPFEHSDVFTEVNQMLRDFNQQTNKMIFHNENFINPVYAPVQITGYLQNRIEYICLKIMSQLDDMNIFEATNERSKIVNFVHAGDFLAPFYNGKFYNRSAMMLNSSEVYRKYESDIHRLNELDSQISDNLPYS